MLSQIFRDPAVFLQSPKRLMGRWGQSPLVQGYHRGHFRENSEPRPLVHMNSSDMCLFAQEWDFHTITVHEEEWTRAWLALSDAK